MARSRQKSNAVEDGYLLITDAPCRDCLFSKNKLVDDRAKREILRHCYESGSYFICHEATIAGRAVICHNFAKSTDGAGNAAIRVATHFDRIKYVDPTTGTASRPQSPRSPRPDAGLSLREALETGKLTPSRNCRRS